MPNPIDRLERALADRYTIEHELGAGGMATVYLAEDLKHHRKVAVKVLRPELAAVLGAERFLQEITTTANLQHPHILPLFDSGEADSFLYYVMPFIDGETLRDKLDRETQLGIDEAVKITREVADALDYAHGNNVIHRDIKPENILLHNGRPMVADFGIALAVSAAAGGRMTETGMSLGTPHYMSPEQATADKDLTNRSDIYSLASVLYEMLTGEPPHTGGSAQAIVMKIVTDEVRPVMQLRKSVPPHVAAATGKALAKLAADRFESAKAFADALSNPAFTTPGVGSFASAPAAVGARNRATVVMSAVAALFLVVALWGWLRPIPTEPVSHHRIVLGRMMGVAVGSVMYGSAISPDGRTIVYVDSTDGGTQLFAKRRDQLDATPIAGTEGGLGPFFSPDGSWIGFIVRGEIRKVPVGGGGALTVAGRAEMVTPSATWLEDGTIYYVSDGFELSRVNANGGESDLVVTAGASFPRGVVQVQALPPSLGVLLSGCTSGCSRADIWVYDARSDTTRLLVENAWGGWYTPTGHLLYTATGGDAFAYEFDLDALEVQGGAVPVLAGVAPAGLTFSDAGILLYQRGVSINQQQLVWVERNGAATAIASDWIDAFDGPALSPDGTRLAVSISPAIEEQIWIKELDDGPLSKISFEGTSNVRPSWSPDGNTVMFISDREIPSRAYTRRADATGEAAQVASVSAGVVVEATYTADGAWMVFRTEVPNDLYGLRVGVDTVATPLFVTEHSERQPTVSPDGRWLAYMSDESGRYEVYVRPFPNTDGGKWSVSVDGGREPLWSHSGRELFYRSGGMLVSAQIVPGPTFAIGERRPLFGVIQYSSSTSNRQYDITPDDQRFVMIEFGGDELGELVLIENWFEVLEERVGGGD